jgi:uncharacterized protein with FMN-binding domain
VRTNTKTTVGIIGLGVLGLSYQLGTTATASTGTFAQPTTAATESANPTPSESGAIDGPTPVSPGSQGSETINTPTQPSASASASPSASATKATSNSGSSVSKSGDAIESGFGPVQVKVTKSGGKITDITYLQSVATHGRAAAFPYLVQYAIQANGSNFANLSGATFTTNAFKQSLESALAKF